MINIISWLAWLGQDSSLSLGQAYYNQGILRYTYLLTRILNKQKLKITINSKLNEKLQLEIAKLNYYTEKREKKRDFTILVVVTGLLQFYKFLIISRIEDV